MTAKLIVEAEVRTGKGTAASRRARRDGKVPVVVYGGGEDEQYLLVDHNKIMHQLEIEAFHSALIQIHVGDDLQRAVLRDVQMHPYRARVMHLDFQRVSRKDRITMTVPFHFKGEENCPGVKVEAGIFSPSMMSVDVNCLGSDLPEYVEVDVSELNIGDSISLNAIKLPEGVDFSPSYQESDMELSVASVLAPKGPTVSEEEEAEGEEGVEGAEGEGAADSEEGASEE